MSQEAIIDIMNCFLADYVNVFLEIYLELVLLTMVLKCESSLISKKH